MDIERETLQASIRRIKIGTYVSAFLATGTKLSGDVAFIGDDYITLKRPGYPTTHVAIKSIISWSEGNVTNQG